MREQKRITENSKMNSTTNSMKSKKDTALKMKYVLTVKNI